MSFRKYGGIQFSSTNNYVYSQFTSSNTLGTTKFGYNNTTLPTLSVFNVDEAYIARLHIQDYIMFSDGSTQTTAYVSTDVPLLNADNVFTGANNTFNDITTHNIFVEPGYSITLRDASDNTSTSTLAQAASTCLITNNAANGKISLQTRLNTGDPLVEHIYCENGNHAVLQSNPFLTNPAKVDCLEEQITLYGNTPEVDTPPPSGDSSNKIATTGWVSAALDLSSYPTLAANNVFTGANNTFNDITVANGNSLILTDGPSNTTTLTQSGSLCNIANTVNSGSVVVSTNNSGGTPSTNLSVSNATTSISSTNLSFTGTETHNGQATFNNNVTITNGATLQILGPNPTPVGLNIYTSGGANGNIWIEAVSTASSGTRLNFNTSPANGPSVNNMYLQNGNTVGIEGAAGKGIYLTDGNLNFYSDTTTFNSSGAVTFKGGWGVTDSTSAYGTQAFQNSGAFTIQSTSYNGVIKLNTKGASPDANEYTHVYMSGNNTAYIQGSSGGVMCVGDTVNLYSSGAIPTMTHEPTVYPPTSLTTTQIASTGYVNAAITAGTSGYALLSANNVFTGTTNTFNAVTINTTSSNKLTLQDGSNISTLAQSTSTLNIANTVSSGSVVVSTKNSGGTPSNTLTANSNGLTVLRAVGPSAISEFIIKDSSGQNQSIEYIPQSTIASVNPIISTNDAVMVVKGGAIDTDNSLSITNWSSNPNGLRLTNISNTLTYSSNSLALTSAGLTYAGSTATFNTYVKITSGGSCQAVNAGGGIGADFRVVNASNNSQYTQWYQSGTISAFTTYGGGQLNFGDTNGTYLSVANSNVTIPNGATLQILGPTVSTGLSINSSTVVGGICTTSISGLSTSTVGSRINFNTSPANGPSVTNMYLQNGNTVYIQAAVNKGISLTNGDIIFYSDTTTFNSSAAVTFKGGWAVTDSTFGTQAFQNSVGFTIQSTSNDGRIQLNTKGSSPDATEYTHLYMSGNDTAYIQGSSGRVSCVGDTVNLYSASTVPTMTVPPTYPSTTTNQIASTGYVNAAINTISSTTPVLFFRGYKYFTSTNSLSELCTIKFSFTNVSTITTSDTYTCRFTIRYDYNTSSSTNPNSTNSYTAYYGYLVIFPGRLTISSTSFGYLNNAFYNFGSGTTISSAYTAANRFYWTDDYVNKYTNPTSTAPSQEVISIFQNTSLAVPSSNPMVINLFNPTSNGSGSISLVYNLSISVYFEVVNSSNSSLGVSTTYTGFDNVQKTF